MSAFQSQWLDWEPMKTHEAPTAKTDKRAFVSSVSASSGHVQPEITPPERKKDVLYRIQQALDWVPGLALFIPTPSPGKEGNIVLMQADRLVDFYNMKGEPNRFWWSDIYKIAYGDDGVPIRESFGKVPGDQLDIAKWE